MLIFSIAESPQKYYIKDQEKRFIPLKTKTRQLLNFGNQPSFLVSLAACQKEYGYPGIMIRFTGSTTNAAIF
jgi:hypothetical protein